MLALARQGFRRTKRSSAEGCGRAGNPGNAGKTATAPVNRKRPQLRRQTGSVAESLPSWAAKNARNISMLRALLEFSRGVKPADACMVRDCTARIPTGSAVQVCIFHYIQYSGWGVLLDARLLWQPRATADLLLWTMGLSDHRV